LLDEGRTDHAYEKLVIVATPKLLGALRNAISDDVARLLADSFAKNMTRCSPEQIRAVLQS
jgi:protein required for attachment to host cells